MYDGKTLVVLFCMHRSGSSFAGRFLQRLGMSLGPFELLGADASNPHGHFEAAPIVALNRRLQLESCGFEGDYPRDPAVLQRFRDAGGEPSDGTYSDGQRDEGTRLIEQLVGAGRVSGFKDPRTALTWPFWEGVLERFPGLRIVALSQLRSPHEIAMSMFQRSQGDCSYRDALDITAVHYRRMKEILDRWPGERAVLQFEPRSFARQARHAAAVCGLPWDEPALAEVYDPMCRHHAPAKIVHEAQELYEQLGAEGNGSGRENRTVAAVESPKEAERAPALTADMALREQLLQRRCASLANVEAENRVLQEQNARCNAESQALIGRVRELEAVKAAWDEYRRTRAWAFLRAVSRIERALLPRRRNTTNAARPRRGLLGFWRRLRGTAAQDAAAPPPTTKNHSFPPVLSAD
jgi:hypothetical protein